MELPATQAAGLTLELALIVSEPGLLGLPVVRPVRRRKHSASQLRLPRADLLAQVLLLGQESVSHRLQQ